MRAVLLTFLFAVPALMAAPAPVAKPVTADVVLGVRNSSDMKALAAHLQSAGFLKKAVAIVPDVPSLQGKSDAAKWLREKMRVMPSATGVRVIIGGVDDKDALALLEAIADQHLADRNPNRDQILRTNLGMDGGEVMMKRVAIAGRRGGLIRDIQTEMPRDRASVRSYMRQMDQSYGDGVVVQQPTLDSARGSGRVISEPDTSRSRRLTEEQLRRLRDLPRR